MKPAYIIRNGPLSRERPERSNFSPNDTLGEIISLTLQLKPPRRRISSHIVWKNPTKLDRIFWSFKFFIL